MLQCPRCKRANPDDAVFCHFEGAELRPVAAGAVPRNHMLHEFVFPSGRRCRTFDELVLGCQYEWDDARELLTQGAFAKFLAGIGRLDLARVSEEARLRPSADVALTEFLGQLPVAAPVKGPKLDLQPRRMVLGHQRVGETTVLPLTISNSGQGLLRGSVTLSEGDDWLRLADGTGARQCPVSTGRSQQVILETDTTGLVPQTYSAKLTVITNGGVAEVPVRLDVVALPFTRPPFVGCGSPRELAEKMRAQAKAGVALLESGEVEQWFHANGWPYPVVGATARGVAAVQQFFEAMGLARPPQLYLTEYESHHTCYSANDTVDAQVVLATEVKKWVYASITSDEYWLQVTTPEVSGPQQAAIGYRVDASLLRPGVLYAANLTVQGNGGQALVLRVTAEVRKPQEPFTRRLLKPFFLAAILGLVYRLLLAGPADVYARVLLGGPGAGEFATWLQPPNLDAAYVRHFVLATWWLGAVGGLVLLWRHGTQWADLVSGLVAGAVAGVAGCATLACLLPWLDCGPRLLLWAVAGRVSQSGLAEAVWLWTPVWVVLTALWWALWWAAAGFLLGFLGSRGRQVLDALAWPVAWLVDRGTQVVDSQLPAPLTARVARRAGAPVQ